MHIHEKTTGKENSDYANFLINLAGLYEKMGRYPEVEQMYLKALKIKEKVIGKENSEYALFLNNIVAFIQVRATT